MWGARLLLAVGVALAISACARQPQYVQEAPSKAYAAAPAAGALYSSSPAYAQQSYEQGIYQPAEQPSPAVGGPYVAAPYGYASAPVAVPAAAEPAYTLDAGDKLRVVVFGQDGITNSYIVDAGGKVNMPLIGAVPARGLTAQQLAAAIATRLKQGFVREPHVTVEIETYRPFFILGEVTTPGQYPYVANLTAEMAVAIAGGFAPRAYKKTVELTRKTGGQQVHVEVPLE